MHLADIVAASQAIASTRSRLAKVSTIAELLRSAQPGEVALVVSYLSGQLPQRRAGVGWTSFRVLPPPTVQSTLTVGEVDDAFRHIESAAGSGSTAIRKEALRSLLSQATADEQRFLADLVTGELRQGALAGIMSDAVAATAGLKTASIRRASMLAGSLPQVAAAALSQGIAGLDQFHLTVGLPIQPMLAQAAPNIEEGLRRAGPASVEWKIDGVRIQVHRQGSNVRVFTRTLDLITDRVPEIVDTVRSFSASSFILDGEAVVLRPDGRPRPFQETGSRVATQGKVAELRRTLPLTPFFFDLLHLDGEDLIDLPASMRYARATAAVPESYWVPRIVPAKVENAKAFLKATIAAGHEGVMVKSLDSAYEAGRRGAGWIKVKPYHTLDLVILAAEWGHGRRRGWLSNLHLGALDPATGEFVMLGKTFKGLTDDMLQWQTERLQQLESHRDSWTVYVRPELVAEVAFDGIQTSPRYPGGMALRFARVVRYREDKTAEASDTIATVRDLYALKAEG